jgi:hypothetical protein
MAWRQRREQRRIDDDEPGLMERARQVLPRREVDRGLPADAAVDLCEQRGRNADPVDAAQPGRRGEAGEIADDAAAERDDGIAAAEPERGERVPQRGEMARRLGALAVRNADELAIDACTCERPQRAWRVQRGDIRLAHHGDATEARSANTRAEPIESAHPDGDM